METLASLKVNPARLTTESLPEYRLSRPFLEALKLAFTLEDFPQRPEREI